MSVPIVILHPQADAVQTSVHWKEHPRACRCLQRLEWNRAKESEADEARVERERERMAMLLIDWHDFSVVRTIDFDESEDMTLLGPPVTKQNVIQMNRGGDAEDDGEPALPLCHRCVEASAPAQPSLCLHIAQAVALAHCRPVR